MARARMAQRARWLCGPWPCARSSLRMVALAAALAWAAAGLAAEPGSEVPSRVSDVRLELQFEGLAWGDGLPLRTARNGMHGERPDDASRLVTHGRLAVGIVRDDWKLEAFWRHDDRLEFHPDTADLLFALRNDVPLEPDRQYRLRIDASGIEGAGIGVARAFGGDSVTAGVRVNLLRATALIDGRLDGRLRADADGEITADARLDYGYSTDDVLQRPRQRHDAGWGATLDLSLQVQWSDAWRMEAKVEDALALVHWRDAPYTRARLRLARPRLAADGTLDNAALLSGRESARARWQRLPVRYQLLVEHLLARDLHLYGRLRGIDDDVLPEFGLRLQTGAGSQLSIGWNTRASALLLGFSTAPATLRLGSDTIDAQTARWLELDLALATDLQ